MKRTINDLGLKTWCIFSFLILSFCTFTTAASGNHMEYNYFSGNSFPDGYSTYSFPFDKYQSGQAYTPYSDYHSTGDGSKKLSDTALFDGPGGDPIGGLPLKDNLVFFLLLTVLYAAGILFRNSFLKKQVHC